MRCFFQGAPPSPCDDDASSPSLQTLSGCCCCCWGWWGWHCRAYKGWTLLRHLLFHVGSSVYIHIAENGSFSCLNPIALGVGRQRGCMCMHLLQKTHRACLQGYLQLICCCGECDCKLCSPGSPLLPPCLPQTASCCGSCTHRSAASDVHRKPAAVSTVAEGKHLALCSHLPAPVNTLHVPGADKLLSASHAHCCPPYTK